eukprot:2077658-Karenia_brevis.AAC.1
MDEDELPLLQSLRAAPTEIDGGSPTQSTPQEMCATNAANQEAAASSARRVEVHTILTAADNALANAPKRRRRRKIIYSDGDDEN